MDGVERTELIEPDSQRVLPQHVKRALAYMRANMAERITLEDLASACAISERTLLRQFRQFVGLAPLAYLRRLRLNTAKSELAGPQNNDAVADIAERCGFSHLGRFATEYRRLFGETPSATRQRVRARMADSALSLPLSATDAPRKKPSLVILPLRTETLQESAEARDLTEQLAATLSRMRIASVKLADPSRISSRNAPQPRNAGTEYCLLGRLTRRDERTRVIVRLVDIATDRHLWGDSFDGSANNPFELQDRVVDAVLCSVVSHITDAEIERAYGKDPRDLGARDLALQALPFILNANAASAKKAATILHRAIDIDPADSVAEALLAFSQLQLVGYYGIESQGTALNAGLHLSQHAVSLDSRNPLALVARAAAAEWLLQSDEADTLLTRALAIDPTSTWAWERRGYGWLNQHPNDPNRAIADFQRALQLRGPGRARTNCLHGIGCAHLCGGRWEDAELWLRKALAEDPDANWVHRTLSRLALKRGDLPGIAWSVERLRRAHPYLTVSFLADNYPVRQAGWLEALASAGMPLA